MPRRKNRQWLFFAVMAPIMAFLGAAIYVMGGSVGRLDLSATFMVWMGWGLAAMCVFGFFATWPKRDK